MIGAQGAQNNAGRVYVFEQNGGAWPLTQTLTPDPPTQYGFLGRSVAAAGDIIVAGAPGSQSHGRVYIFGPGEASTWIQGADLPIVLPSPIYTNVRFGYDVALDESGTRLLAGAIDDSEAGTFAGAAFLLRREESGDWTFQKKLIGSNLGGGESWGGAVALAGDFALIGAINSPNPGKAHLYGGVQEIDCTGSGQPDVCDIIAGKADDADGNLIPDECEGHPADFNGDGSVNAIDLLILLSAWGPCAAPDAPGDCPADLNGDGAVNVADMLSLLGAWN